MEIRDLLVDGVDQLNEWLVDAVKEMSSDQLNWLPEGKTVSAGFDAWHVLRTQDNVTNFVFQRKTPVWLEQGFHERTQLPKVEQGTGMSLEDARAIRIEPDVLLEYAAAVSASCRAYLVEVPAATLDEVQMVKPLGEMPKWKVFRMVVMTHGFMHLGEINLIKGMQGMKFAL